MPDLVRNLDKPSPIGAGGENLTSIGSYLKAYSTISRFEYIPGVAPGLFLPLLIGVSTLSILYSSLFIEAFIVFSLLYFSGFIINSLADRDIDRNYQTFKGNISEAVDLLGVGNVKIILSIQVVISVLLGLHIALVLSNIYIAILVSLGALFGLGYSVPPFNFKVKGVWHAIALASSAFFIPLMFMYLVVAESIQLLDIFLIFGITVAHYSMEMANQAADHMEDSREGILTPTVRMGLSKALKSSIIMTTVGMIMVIFTIGIMYVSSEIPAILGLGSGSSQVPAMSVILLLMAVIVGIGYYYPIKGLRDLYSYSIDNAPLEVRIVKIKNRVSYARWQASGIMGVIIVLGFLFGATLSAPVMLTNDVSPDQEMEQSLDINQLRIDNVRVTVKEGQDDFYADLTVRLKNPDDLDKDEISDVTAFVDAGTAKKVFTTSQAQVDSSGRARVQIPLGDYNDTEVWYFIYLIYHGKRSSYTWSEPSSKNLYIYDAALTKTENLLSDSVELTVFSYNAAKIRDPNTITLKIEWSPILVEWSTNNVTINPQQVWTTKISRDIMKEWLVDSSPVRITLYYDDVELDVMELDF